MRIPIEAHKPWPKKIYKFFVVNSKGQVIEGDLPSEEHARTVIDFLSEQEGMTGLTIEVDCMPDTKRG